MSDWITCGATLDAWWAYGYSEATFATKQYCGASHYNGGMSFAELLSAGDNSGLADQNLGHVFNHGGGANGGLPCGTLLEIRLPGHWRTHTIEKSDIGSGQLGDAHFKLDLHPEIMYRLGWQPNGDVQVRIPGPGGGGGTPPPGPAPPPPEFHAGPYDWSDSVTGAWGAWAWYGGHADSNARFVEDLLGNTRYCDENGPR